MLIELTSTKQNNTNKQTNNKKTKQKQKTKQQQKQNKQQQKQLFAKVYVLHFPPKIRAEEQQRNRNKQTS